MKNWFADISMTRKLTIGFGAVLLLTIALAISGWLSLSGVIHRSELMERIAALNEALDELRVARLQYMLDNGDAKSAEAVTEALDHFAAQHRDIAPAFRDPENRMLLQKQGEQIQRYRATLSRMREAYAAGVLPGRIWASRPLSPASRSRRWARPWRRCRSTPRIATRASRRLRSCA